MAVPDSGKVEDYTESEMNELLALFESDKNQLTKNQKAAVARYNFKKGKGEPIVFKGQGGASPPEASAPVAQAAGTPPATDITAFLPPDKQALAGADPATLSKEDKIVLAKAKSQAAKAQMAAKAAGGAPAGDAKPSGPSPQEIARKKALEHAHAAKLQERFGDAVDAWSMMVDWPYATVKSERVLDVVRYLNMEMGFDQIRDLTGTDYPPDHVEIVYNLYRHADKANIAIKCKLPREATDGSDLPHLPSIVSVFVGADWLEREVFDLLGVRFDGHPYMRRLLMPDGWTGHPLRKDYDSKKEQFVGLDEFGNDIVTFDSDKGW